METQKNQVIERLKEATNILVAVSANPSVDQLSGAIGLTLLLNKLNKHATAVFSGKVPSTLEFLQPEKTLEKNTDSLRDFIIALDKSKADKLRYKVEDEMVKIFITPYMTSISDKDLEFSQGDFNVEVVIALGVNEQQDLDQAITTNGRILHDATVISIKTKADGSLGSINWVDEAASSLCEMLVQLGISLKADVLDSQMSTALLTGIVAETSRFSNEKTSSETMQMSAKLMTAGANQQLVASQLQPPATEKSEPEKSDAEDLQLPEIKEDTDDHNDEPGDDEAPPAPEAADGTLSISHTAPEEFEADQEIDPEAAEEPVEPPVDQIHIDEEGQLKPADELKAPETHPKIDTAVSDTPARLITEPPTMGGTLTANTEPEELESITDILGTTNKQDQAPMLSHNNTFTSDQTPKTVPLPPLPPIAAAPTITPPSLPTGPHTQTLSELEELVTSGHNATDQIKQTDDLNTDKSPEPDTDLGAARDAVSQAMSGSTPQILEPVKSLNAQPLDLNLGEMPADSTSLASAFASNSSATEPMDSPSATNPSITTPPLVPLDPPAASHNGTSNPEPISIDDSSGPTADSKAPPPVPPPMMPPGQFIP